MLTIYAKNGCYWCTKARELAESMNIKHEYLNVDENHDHMLALYNIKPDTKTLPQIWWNGRYIGGCTEFMQEVENTIGGYGDGKI